MTYDALASTPTNRRRLRFAFTPATNAFGGTNTSGTTLTVETNLIVPAPAANLVGEWLNGSTNLADVAGYSPAGKHDGYAVGSLNYQFTSDVPPGKIGQSLFLNVGDTGIAIKNSATVDGSYTNTFDDIITNEFTVTCWAKGTMNGWACWVGKRGDNGQGWMLRENGGNNPTFTIRGTGGNDDMQSTIVTDDNWHQYAGVYSAATGIRSLYVDGVLAAQQTGEVSSYSEAPAYHLCIGAEEGGWWGSAAGAFSKFKVYDVRIYDAALTVAQINSFLTPSVPKFIGPPVINGNQLVLTYSGTLLQATNVSGPWTSTGATSPYTNIISTHPQMFFRLSNP